MRSANAEVMRGITWLYRSRVICTEEWPMRRRHRHRRAHRRGGHRRPRPTRPIRAAVPRPANDPLAQLNEALSGAFLGPNAVAAPKVEQQLTLRIRRVAADLSSCPIFLGLRSREWVRNVPLKCGSVDGGSENNDRCSGSSVRPRASARVRHVPRARQRAGARARVSGWTAKPEVALHPALLCRFRPALPTPYNGWSGAVAQRGRPTLNAVRP